VGTQGILIKKKIYNPANNFLTELCIIIITQAKFVFILKTFCLTLMYIVSKVTEAVFFSILKKFFDNN
jgi:hypothetical protein